LEWTVECLGGGCLATLVDGYISQVMTRKRTWCMNVMNGTPLQVIPILKTNLLSKLLTSRWWVISYVDIMNWIIHWITHLEFRNYSFFNRVYWQCVVYCLALLLCVSETF
jgi:fructose-specific phosphotransferase system IIC component